MLHFRVERVREDKEGADAQITSKITTVPKNVPIDYFDPDFWNKTMSVAQKVKYLERNGRPVVALPAAEYCSSWELCDKWKDWSNTKFMRRLGNDVLALYKMPTDAEIARVTGEGPDSDEEETDSDFSIEDLQDEEDADRALRLHDQPMNT